jgi:uncharacterized protein
MNNEKRNPFSIVQFVGIVIVLSWPFQIIYCFLGDTYRPLLLVSMVMVAVATYASGKWIFQDGFAGAGWSWGKPLHYLYVFLLALFLWLVPSVLERLLGWYSAKEISLATIVSSFAISSTLTLIPAFSEEFGWRGYLLPRLLEKYHYRKALLLHGVITWIWHLPVLFSMGVVREGNPTISILLVLVVSIIPTVMHAIVFAYIWARTGSLAVSTMYHVAFDEVRDALETNIGLGPLGQNWQMVVLTAVGIVLLWKAPWEARRENPILI